MTETARRLAAITLFTSVAGTSSSSGVATGSVACTVQDLQAKAAAGGNPGAEGGGIVFERFDQHGAGGGALHFDPFVRNQDLLLIVFFLGLDDRVERRGDVGESVRLHLNLRRRWGLIRLLLFRLCRRPFGRAEAGTRSRRLACKSPGLIYGLEAAFSSMKN